MKKTATAKDWVVQYHPQTRQITLINKATDAWPGYWFLGWTGGTRREAEQFLAECRRNNAHLLEAR